MPLTDTLAGLLLLAMILPAYLIGPAEDLAHWWRRR